jgi:hypothetical protein
MITLLRVLKRWWKFIVAVATIIGKVDEIIRALRSLRDKDEDDE